jgi:hypothetical protein
MFRGWIAYNPNEKSWFRDFPYGIYMVWTTHIRGKKVVPDIPPTTCTWPQQAIFAMKEFGPETSPSACTCPESLYPLQKCWKKEFPYGLYMAWGAYIGTKKVGPSTRQFRPCTWRRVSLWTNFFRSGFSLFSPFSTRRECLWTNFFRIGYRMFSIWICSRGIPWTKFFLRGYNLFITCTCRRVSLWTNFLRREYSLLRPCIWRVGSLWTNFFPIGYWLFWPCTCRKGSLWSKFFVADICWSVHVHAVGEVNIPIFLSPISAAQAMYMP